MAKSSRPKTKKSKIDPEVTDAVEVSDTAKATPSEAGGPDPKSESAPAADDTPVENVDGITSDDATLGDQDKTGTLADSALGNDTAASSDDDIAASAPDSVEADPDADQGLDDTDIPTDAQRDFDTESTTEAAPSSTADRDVPMVAPEPPQTRSSSGFVPMVLGGLLAGAIGYGIGTYYPLTGNAGTDELRQDIAAQGEQLAALDDRLANLPPPDVSDLDARMTELGDQAATQVSDLSDRLTQQMAAFEERLTELEKQPNADGTLSDAALEAYQRELEGLRAELDAQQETVMTAAAQAEADLAAARAEAAELEQEALAAAEAAAARAALNRIATAVETGASFEGALTDLNTDDVPQALKSAAETGVATQAELIAAFPAAARDALATARAEGVSDDAAGLGGFLRSQFDVRSTAPRDGTGPDAVLSRAEAAVKEGRIADALAELEALPEVARAEMTDWTAQATERAEVLDAIAALSETYN